LTFLPSHALSSAAAEHNDPKERILKLIADRRRQPVIIAEHNDPKERILKRLKITICDGGVRAEHNDPKERILKLSVVWR